MSSVGFGEKTMISTCVSTFFFPPSNEPFLRPFFEDKFQHNKDENEKVGKAWNINANNNLRPK